MKKKPPGEFRRAVFFAGGKKETVVFVGGRKREQFFSACGFISNRFLFCCRKEEWQTVLLGTLFSYA